MFGKCGMSIVCERGGFTAIYRGNENSDLQPLMENGVLFPWLELDFT